MIPDYRCRTKILIVDCDSFQVVKLDGGEYYGRAGSFNELRAVTNEQWDMLAQMIKSTKGS